VVEVPERPLNHGRVPIDPDHYRWKLLRDPYRKLLTDALPNAAITDPVAVADSLALEDTSHYLAVKRLRRDPRVYLANALRSLLTFSWDIDAVRLKRFQYMQQTGQPPPRDWFWPGNPQDFCSSAASRSLRVFVYVLSALSLAGLLVAARERDPFMIGPACLVVCLAVAHAITWMDMPYYYVKWPLLFGLSFYFLDRVRDRSDTVLRKTVGLCVVWIVAAILAFWSLTFWVQVYLVHPDRKGALLLLGSLSSSHWN